MDDSNPLPHRGVSARMTTLLLLVGLVGTISAGCDSLYRDLDEVELREADAASDADVLDTGDTADVADAVDADEPSDATDTIEPTDAADAAEATDASDVSDTADVARDADVQPSCDAGGDICEGGDIDKIIDLDSYARTTCARRQSGSVVCWGEGSNGQIGHGSRDDAPLPAEVVGISDAQELTVGANHSCVVDSAGAVFCWGDNAHGQLGLPTSVGETARPVEIIAASGVTNLSAGSGFTCGIDAAGQAVCWGRNHVGQLGRGTTSASEARGPVSGLTDVVDVEASEQFACAVKSDGTVWCWGLDGDAQLGNGANQGTTSTPTQVVGLSDVEEISLNTKTGCARQQSGAVWCWGETWGGVTGSSSAPGDETHVPVQTDTIDDAEKLFSGSYHNCALRASGELWCWGKGGVGELGLGSAADKPAPVQIPFYAGKTVVDASGGGAFTCVVVDTGRVYCSGAGESLDARVLGDNQHPDGAQPRYAPTPVATIAPIDDELNLCRDGLDNDGQDGADCADPDCASDLGSSVGQSVTTGFFSGAEGNHFVGSCGTDTNGRERAFTWTAPSTAEYTLTTEGSGLSTVLYVLDTCHESAAGAEIACDVATAADGRSSLTLSATAGETYVIVIDTPSNAGLGTYVLSIND
jgi:alpha-tubulin suppressor-like RCC1 family protein